MATLKTQTITILDLPIQNKRCPDYDNDCLCFTPNEAFHCWIGDNVQINGKWYYTEQAKGYCPLIHLGGKVGYFKH